MKPRTNWTINNGGATARRSDGVLAYYDLDLGDFAYAVSRIENGMKAWLSTITGRVRTFRTLAGAMEAADRSWPLE